MGRRSGVRAASDTSIEIDFYYKGVRCRERLRLKPTKPNVRYAENLKGEIENKIERGTFDYTAYFPDSSRAQLFAPQPGAIIALSNYLETWLNAARTYTKSSTWNGYRKIVRNQLIPAFGDLKLTEIRRRHVKDFAFKRNISPKTLGNIISPLRVALDEAVEDELIDLNPLAGWKIKRRDKRARGRQDKIDPFSDEERQAILKALTGQGRNLIEFAFWTGLRTSELCALDWPDIDWVQGYAYITKSLTQASSEPEEPKTEAGERRVKLLPPALAALTAQKAHTYLAGKEVFQNPRTAERWVGDQPIRKTLWIHALKRAGVRYRNPYQTRHTFASMMLMAGENVMWVAEQMGHTDWTFTARTYSRFIPDDAPDAGRKAAERWSASGQHESVNA